MRDELHPASDLCCSPVSHTTMTANSHSRNDRELIKPHCVPLVWFCFQAGGVGPLPFPVLQKEEDIFVSEPLRFFIDIF